MSSNTIYLSKGTVTKTQARSSAALAQAKRSGAGITHTAKYGAGGNKQHKGDRNDLAVDMDTENLTVKRVEKSMGKLIMKGRNAKGWTQKELAQKINEKPQVVNEYESGKAVPNSQITNKIQRALNMYISGKKAGEPVNANKDKK